jgi:hypothetical protein
MKHRILALVALQFGLLASAAAQMPAGEFIEAKGAVAAVILAHGRGQDPDGPVVGPLRRAIAKDAGILCPCNCQFWQRKTI